MNVVVDTLKRAGWAPTLVFAAHIWFCYGWIGYETFPRLDIPMHILGGAAIAFFLWTAIGAGVRSGILGRPSRLALVALAFTSTVSCTLFWEFAEFLADRYFGTNTQAGLGDTLLDMMLGLVGGAVLIAIASFRPRGMFRIVFLVCNVIPVVTPLIVS